MIFFRPFNFVERSDSAPDQELTLKQGELEPLITGLETTGVRTALQGERLLETARAGFGSLDHKMLLVQVLKGGRIRAPEARRQIESW